MQYMIPPQLYASHPSHEQKQKMPTKVVTKLSPMHLARIGEQQQYPTKKSLASNQKQYINQGQKQSSNNGSD